MEKVAQMAIEADGSGCGWRQWNVGTGKIYRNRVGERDAGIGKCGAIARCERSKRKGLFRVEAINVVTVE